jgi:hypothetical protein
VFVGFFCLAFLVLFYVLFASWNIDLLCMAACYSRHLLRLKGNAAVFHDRKREFRPVFDKLQRVGDTADSGFRWIMLSASVPQLMRDELMVQFGLTRADTAFHIGHSLRPELRLIRIERAKEDRVLKDLGPIQRSLDWLLAELLEKGPEAPKTVVFSTANAGSEAYEYFAARLGQLNFWPPGASDGSGGTLVAQYNALTDSDEKRRVEKELKDPNSILRVVFATTSLGHGFDMKGTLTCPFQVSIFPCHDGSSSVCMCVRFFVFFCFLFRGLITRKRVYVLGPLWHLQLA